MNYSMSLQWCHNEHDGVSSHQPRLFTQPFIQMQIKKSSKLRVTCPCAGNSPVTGEFFAQRASNAENVSILWRHQAMSDDAVWPGYHEQMDQLCRNRLKRLSWYHQSDAIMGAMASQITSLTIVYSTVFSGADQKHQSSASLNFMRGIHRRPVNSPHKWPVTRQMFPFGDVIMSLRHAVYTEHTDAWVGVTMPISSVFRFFSAVSNTCWLLNITFIFHRCHCSSAVATLDKYECDYKNIL